MILRSRYEQCAFYHGEDKHLCNDLKKAYDEAAVNWYVKCEYAFMMGITIQKLKKQFGSWLLGQIASHK